MLRLNEYPAVCQATISAFTGASVTWARAAGFELDDVRQELALAALAGTNPSCVVPAALGIRRLPSGRWVAFDPAAHPNVDLYEYCDTFAAGGEPEDKAGDLGIGGTADIAARLGVTRRRAQQIVAAQRRRNDRNGDLFQGGE